MPITIDDERRAQLMAQLRSLYQEEFGEELSAFRAERVLDFFLGALGPQVYNQAVQDARKFMQEKLDDLDAEVYEIDGI